MKKLTEYDRVSCYLDSLFCKLNEKYFENSLSKPVITITPTSGAYGHFSCGKIWDNGETQRHEINIGSGTLNRPIENIVATLIHEMVHYYCQTNDIQDCSRGGTYHNRRFKEEAEKRGLIIEKDDRYGWTLTTPSDDLILWCAEQDLQEIRLVRVDYSTSARGGSSSSGSGVVATAPKKKSSTRKYACPCCGLIIRATKDIGGKVACMDCERLFVQI